MTSYYRDPTASAPNVPRRIGITALIERGDAFLVERRADNDAEEWAFIGGGLREDERVLDALHREVREETAFTVDRATLFGIFLDPTRIVAYPDGNVCGFVSVVFRIRPTETGQPILTDESSEMRFVSRDELARLPFWPAHQPIRDALLGNRDEPVVE